MPHICISNFHVGPTLVLPTRFQFGEREAASWKVPHCALTYLQFSPFFTWHILIRFWGMETGKTRNMWFCTKFPSLLSLRPLLSVQNLAASRGSISYIKMDVRLLLAITSLPTIEFHDCYCSLFSCFLPSPWVSESFHVNFRMSVSNISV